MTQSIDHTAAEPDRPLAVVTGASSGIGLELAKLFARDGHDLVIAADMPLAEAAEALAAYGVRISVVEGDLATEEGVQSVITALGGRPAAALAANVGHGLGKAFLDQHFDDIVHVINTNITGTIRLAYLIGRQMRERGDGRILFTGSIAGLMPGSFQAVYNGTKSFVDSFSFALRNQLTDSGVSVTVLMPGPVDTRFFERADMTDTKVGQDDHKADPADVAKRGYAAMLRGDGDVVAGCRRRWPRSPPQTVLAERHRKMAEPGSAG